MAQYSGGAEDEAFVGTTQAHMWTAALSYALRVYNNNMTQLTQSTPTRN